MPELNWMVDSKLKRTERKNFFFSTQSLGNNSVRKNQVSSFFNFNVVLIPIGSDTYSTRLSALDINRLRLPRLIHETSLIVVHKSAKKSFENLIKHLIHAKEGTQARAGANLLAAPLSRAGELFFTIIAFR